MIFKKNTPLSLIVLSTFVLGILPYIWFTKKEIHLWINNFHHPMLDFFFKYITFLGDGTWVLLITILICLMRLRLGLIALVSYLSSGIIVQFLKRFVFSDLARPTEYLKEYGLYIVDQFEPHKHHTFPSGHSASAFGLFVLFSLWSKNKTMQYFWIILSGLTAWSRVYLSEHFLIDIIVGMLIGYICAITSNHYMSNSRANWMDKKLIKF